MLLHRTIIIQVQKNLYYSNKCLQLQKQQILCNLYYCNRGLLGLSKQIIRYVTTPQLNDGRQFSKYYNTVTTEDQIPKCNHSIRIFFCNYGIYLLRRKNIFCFLRNYVFTLNVRLRYNFHELGYTLHFGCLHLLHLITVNIQIEILKQ